MWKPLCTLTVGALALASLSACVVAPVPVAPVRAVHDEDRDGVPNGADRDRDGDGVRNRADRRPDNPYRR